MIKGKGSGLSFCVSFGRYAGFQKQFNNEFWRIVLGWMSFEICWFDMDVVFGLLLEEKDREFKQRVRALLDKHNKPEAE